MAKCPKALADCQRRCVNRGGALIEYFDEQDPPRFNEITQAFMDGVLPVGDMVDLYLEWFPRPQEWRDFDGLLGGDDEG